MFHGSALVSLRITFSQYSFSMDWCRPLPRNSQAPRPCSFLQFFVLRSLFFFRGSLVFLKRKTSYPLERSSLDRRRPCKQLIRFAFFSSLLPQLLSFFPSLPSTFLSKKAIRAEARGGCHERLLLLNPPSTLSIKRFTSPSCRPFPSLFSLMRRLGVRLSFVFLGSSPFSLEIPFTPALRSPPPAWGPEQADQSAPLFSTAFTVGLQVARGTFVFFSLRARPCQLDCRATASTPGASGFVCRGLRLSSFCSLLSF